MPSPPISLDVELCAATSNALQPKETTGSENLENTRNNKVVPNRKKAFSLCEKKRYVLQSEVVNYLAFVNEDLYNIQRRLLEDTARFKVKLRKIIEEAVSHCYRDLLWQKLLMGVTLAHSSKQKDQSIKITFNEFELLLESVYRTPLQNTDEQLQSLLNLSSSRMIGLIRCLQTKFTEHCRFLISPDLKRQYLVLLNPNYLDCFIMVLADCAKRKSGAFLVYKDVQAFEAELEGGVESKMFRSMSVQHFCEDFINVAAYFAWTQLLASS
ncbi:unnamed protein product [Soboliphyme baturini]|uniref:DH domain-containing protein n=1 Tax=Soboliphyme baturini TaxID=241478 RepID=A0A183ITQ9_9BILA|nr:unnamed protein product [Soboliphyme baturini]